MRGAVVVTGCGVGLMPGAVVVIRGGVGAHTSLPRAAFPVRTTRARDMENESVMAASLVRRDGDGPGGDDLGDLMLVVQAHDEILVGGAQHHRLLVAQVQEMAQSIVGAVRFGAGAQEQVVDVDGRPGWLATGASRGGIGNTLQQWRYLRERA